MTKAVDNERTKLLANAFDRASTAGLAVGILAPLAALAQGRADLHPPLDIIAITIAGWLGAAIMLHLIARRTLGGLKE
jgi:hypothetical protein